MVFLVSDLFTFVKDRKALWESIINDENIFCEESVFLNFVGSFWPVFTVVANSECHSIDNGDSLDTFWMKEVPVQINKSIHGFAA